MQKILISRCLLGEKVRYDGGHCQIQNPILQQWADQGRLVAVCPEVQGGMSIPRIPAEIQGEGGGKAVLLQRAKVQDKAGEDVTQVFLKGANIALDLVKQHHIKIAILKARSPSCGNKIIYDGSFTSKQIQGEGVTAALLSQHHVKIFNEFELEQALAYLQQLETA